ncbi:MAG TPA: phosphoribosylamine--glycine ligase [Gemmatimonadota bacterium]|nr:phosphoribosylamine--glycine ligase [Gemmatimonadota bacterium]
MRGLVVGSGGREHALLWKLSRDHPEHDLLVTRGNGGTGGLARAVDVDPADVAAVAALVEAEDVDFTVVGPEVPLAAGLADLLRDTGRAVFGPGRAAARLEGSKAFAKALMAEAGVPTTAFGTFRTREEAAAFAAGLGIPCVVKASGLAAGKGAIVCRTPGGLEDALDACFVRRDFGAAGDEVVVEEFLEGEELSMIALTDGEALVPLLPSQDHKAALDGDRGPNTGGMGAYAPVSVVDDALRERVLEEIFRPTLAAMADAGAPITGCMYAGLMMTPEGPKVLEWNVRFGDPEAQALLPLLESDLLELLSRATPGGGLAGAAPRWREGACVTVVAAAEGYPGEYAKGSPIRIPDDLEAPDAFDARGEVVFHAGTARRNGELVAAGGRVLNVTAVGGSVGEARTKAYAALERIHAPGLRWRTDIGWREVAREARG